MITFTKESNAVFMTKDGVKTGIPKNAWVFAHPTQADMLVIANKPVFDGVNGIVVPRTDVTIPVSTDFNDLITKLHRDFFVDAEVGISERAYVGFRFDQQAHWECLYQSINVVYTNASNIVQGTTWYVPFLVTHTLTIKEIGMQVLGAGSSGSSFVVAIVGTRSGAYPLLGKVYFNSAPVPATPTGGRSIVVPNVELKPGLYYFGIKTNSMNNLSLRGIPLTATKPLLYVPTETATEHVTRISVTQSYSPTFIDNQDNANWINGAGYTPPLFLTKLVKQIPNAN
jgi:hypothetical protein